MTHAGWYARRRGILEHLESGKVTLVDSGVHDYLCLIADHKNGVCRASAEKIHVLAGAGLSLRAIQRSLAKLEDIGWIKRFLVPGRRGNYHIAIARFFVRDTSGTWLSVNLDRTIDWRAVQFDTVTDPSFICQGGVREVSPIQEVRTLEGRNKTVKSRAKNARPADEDFKNLKIQNPDGRFQAIKEYYETEFKTRNAGVNAHFDGGDSKNLASLLKLQYDKTAEELISWLRNAFDSEGTYPLLPAFRLKQFCPVAASFAKGPLKKNGGTKTRKQIPIDSATERAIDRLLK